MNEISLISGQFVCVKNYYYDEIFKRIMKFDDENECFWEWMNY